MFSYLPWLSPVLREAVDPLEERNASSITHFYRCPCGTESFHYRGADLCIQMPLSSFIFRFAVYAEGYSFKSAKFYFFSIITIQIPCFSSIKDIL